MKKRLAIVTGSSKGLGKALVDAMAKDDSTQVIGLSRTGHAEKLTNYQDVQVDLSKPEELISKFGAIFPPEKFEEVILINNAGWIGEIAPFGKLDPQGIVDIHMVNTVAPALLMNEFVRRYAKEVGEKVVVNISSGAAEKNIDGWSGYSSSKASLNRYTAIAQEESDRHGYGIKYFAVSPGIVDTPMQADIRNAKEENFSRVKDFKNFKIMDELARPEAVAKKILGLIKERGHFGDLLQDVRHL